MSLFLGPIHYWLYRKIQLQEALIQSLVETAADRNWDQTSGEKLDLACGKADLGPLEESIDTGNIHGWLQEKVRLSEARLAFLVTGLLKEDPSRIADLEQAALDFGKRHAVAPSVDASGAFQTLQDSLLDGMPCDHVNLLVEQSPGKVVWQQTQCVHQEYWERAAGDTAVYYALRAQMITGMLAESRLRFYAKGKGLFEIKEEASSCTVSS